MTKRRTIVRAIVAVVIVVTVALSILRPPIGKRLNLPTQAPRLISISRWKPEPFVINDPNRCNEIVLQLQGARRSGAAHKCAPVAAIRIEPESGEPIELQVAPGHWFQNMDIFYKGDAYSMSRAAIVKAFGPVESK